MVVVVVVVAAAVVVTCCFLLRIIFALYLRFFVSFVAAAIFIAVGVEGVMVYVVTVIVVSIEYKDVF